MTDNEIIKALECCWERNCYDCPIHKEDKYCGICRAIIVREALDIIKQQQEHIEVLEAMTTLRNKREYYNRFLKEVWQKEKGELSEPDFDEIYRRYFEQQEMIDALIAGQETLQKHFADKMDKIVEELKRLPNVNSDYWNFADLIDREDAIEIVREVQNESR